jgi:L-seryl-tRNA(Ser) seleniumtransferase
MADKSPPGVLRKIPSVDLILSQPWVKELEGKYARPLITSIIRRSLDDLRQEVLAGRADEAQCDPEQIRARMEMLAQDRLAPSLKELINATGVIIHTNLGRSPLSKRVADRIHRAATSYSNLEYDLEKGARGERNAHLKALMEELTGAGSALAVNNNAAAVLLALSTLAQGKEVIVSRGELIEIGGSFRIPDVMARSNAILREVGSTNRTHLRDYEAAINDNTALLFKAHTSNYKIVGFTKEVDLKEFSQLGKSRGIPTMFDLGSGCLVDLTGFGLEGEHTVQEALAAGIDVVSFSGDKLLGGPQAGILAGRADLIEMMRSNPLTRALRMDKMTLAGLEATLEEYTRPQGPFEGVPTLAMIAESEDVLEEEANSLASAIEEALGDKALVSVEQGEGMVGGGSLPMAPLKGPKVRVKPFSMTPARLERKLRSRTPPLIVVIQDDGIMLDPRTLLQGQASLIPTLIKESLAD